MRPRDASRKQLAVPSIADAERAMRIRELFAELAELNEEVPVIVEGKRDAEALRELGLKGEIITYNRGKGVHEFCDDIHASHAKCVLLMDWDTVGESLMSKLGPELGGLWEEFTNYRRLIRAMCQREVKDIEGIPGLIRKLELHNPPSTLDGDVRLR